MLSDCCPVLSVTLVYCGQTVGWIKMPLNMEVSLGPGDIVLDGDPALPLQKAGQQSPSFADAGKTASCVYCGQMAVYIRMPLGVEVGLGQGNIVLYGDLASPTESGTAPPPLFGPCLLWPNGCPHQQLLSSCYICTVLIIKFIGLHPSHHTLFLDSDDNTGRLCFCYLPYSIYPFWISLPYGTKFTRIAKLKQ